MWKTDIERESRDHSHLSHFDLSVHLRDYLRDNYAGVKWVVVVYDSVKGYRKHNARGLYYHLFRHYGHNIVVGRLFDSGRTPQIDLNSLFWQAYAPRFVSTGLFGWGGSVLHAQRTAQATWDRLVNLGVSPVMLHIFSSGIGGTVASYIDSRFLVTGSLNDDGFATLIA